MWDTQAMTPAQSRAARGLLNWNQDDLAKAAHVSSVTVRNFENGKSAPQRATLNVMRAAFEADGVEFTNGDQPGVRLRSYKLKDARHGPFPIDVDLIGFGATDGKRDITIHVERSALAYLDDQKVGSGAEHMRAFYKHSHRILGIAADKYEQGRTEPDDIVLVTRVDVARG